VWAYLSYNPYAAVWTPTTTFEGPVLGVTTSFMNPNEYGWLQTGGMGAVKMGASVAAGVIVYPHATALGFAGAVGNAMAGTGPVGIMMQATAVVNQGAACFLTIE